MVLVSLFSPDFETRTNKLSTPKGFSPRKVDESMNESSNNPPTSKNKPASDADRFTDPTARSLLEVQDVRRALGAMLASAASTSAYVVVIGLLVWDISKSKLNLGWIGLIEFVPAVLLVFVSGIVAAALSAQIAISTIISFLVRSKLDSVTPIFLMVGLSGISFAFNSPAMRSLIPATAPSEEALPRLVGLSSICWQGGAILGPVIGAFTYRSNPSLAFRCIAVGYGIALVAVLRVSKAAGTDHLGEGVANPPSFGTAVEGLKMMRKQPILMGAISLDLFAVLFGGAVALLPALVDERNWDKGAVGILRAAGGVGGALVTLLLAAKPVRRNIGRVLLTVVAGFGVATIGFGLTKQLWVAIACMALLNAADSVSVFIRATLVPLVTPPDQLGRVSAVEGVFIGASNELGAFESGLAARFLGTTPAIVSGGVLTIAVVCFWWFVFPALRDVDRFADLEPMRSERSGV
jgi:MFS family permease